MSGAPLDSTHFKESGDVYPHDTNGWPVDPGRAGGLGDQRDQGRLAGVNKPATGGLRLTIGQLQMTGWLAVSGCKRPEAVVR